MASLDRLYQRLGLAQREQRKAEEIFRRAKAKSFGGPEMAAVAVFLAHGAGLDKRTKTTLARLSGATKPAFESTAAAVSAELDLRKRKTPTELAVQFGITELAEEAEDTFRMYTSNLSSSADCSRDVYPAAAITRVVRSARAAGKKVKLDASRLQSMCNFKPKELKAVLAQMDEVIAVAKVAQAKAKARSDTKPEALCSPKKRKAAARSDPGSTVPGSATKAASKAQKVSVSNEVYQAWRRRILVETEGSEDVQLGTA